MKGFWSGTTGATLAAVALAAAFGCRDDAGTGTPVNDPVHTIGGDRPATLTLPNGYEDGTPTPLVIVLHGYSGNAGWTDRYFGISSRIEPDRIAVILPNGTRNPQDLRFWNATDYCCDFHGSGVDDVAYLNRLIEDASAHMDIDGVYLIGLSNGGFMSHRMACESMPGLRGIASVAGTTFDDPARCEGAKPISLLHVHGTADEVIRYEGGARRGGNEARYPGAEETVRRWAQRAGCDMVAAQTMPSLDLVGLLAAEETDVTRYRIGCERDIRVELWTIENGPHVPPFDADDFGTRVVAWLLDAGG